MGRSSIEASRMDPFNIFVSLSVFGTANMQQKEFTHTAHGDSSGEEKENECYGPRTIEICPTSQRSMEQLQGIITAPKSHQHQGLSIMRAEPAGELLILCIIDLWTPPSLAKQSTAIGRKREQWQRCSPVHRLTMESRRLRPKEVAGV